MRTTTTLLTIALATGGVLAAAGVVHRRSVDRDWRAMLVVIDTLEDGRAGRLDLRDAPYGETTEGSVWPHYARAIEVLRGTTDFLDRARAASRASAADEVAERAALLTEAAAALDHLRRGAHARDATTAIEWQAGLNARGHRLSDVSALVALATAQARVSLERGEDARAVEFLLDAAQLGRDLAVAPTLIDEMIGCSQLVPELIAELLAEGTFDALSREARAQWLLGLDRIEASLPRSSAAFRGELELFGRYMATRVYDNYATQDLYHDGLEVPLRYRVSWRRAAADYVLRAQQLVPEVEAAFELDPPETVRVLEALQLEYEGDSNPFMRIALPNFASASYSRALCFARLDFLRLALALGLGEERELPVDPFGHGVDVERKSGGVRVSTRWRRGLSLEIVLGT